MKAMMVVGTTSHAGKSFLTAAICRLLYRKGWRVCPFKGQNMALNAYVTASGGEMGHAQALQAWAAGTTPRVEMNPILLKPQGNMTSQVIIKGEVAGKTTAFDYYQDYFDRGWQAICECIASLEADYDFLVCEGAGSPAEINLKHRDLTNMRIAKYLNAPTLLVVDIDRGGAFAHVVGTLELLDPEERVLIKGVAINKFRGAKSLLDSGITWLEQRTGIPVVGVIPMIEQIFPAEDSLDLLERRSRNSNYDLRIAIIRLPRIANFTDFDPLEAEPRVFLEYIQPGQSLGKPDAVIIPGSKTTIADLKTLHQTGMAQQLQDYVSGGGVVMGICGGLQMLGNLVCDPDQLEGDNPSYEGALGLLPLETVLEAKKITRQRQVSTLWPNSSLSLDGYEIHNGVTKLLSNQGLKYLFEDETLGFVKEDLSVWGSYLHGIFDNGCWRRHWLNHLLAKKGLPLMATEISNYSEQREAMLETLGDFVAQYLDLTPFL